MGHGASLKLLPLGLWFMTWFSHRVILQHQDLPRGATQSRYKDSATLRPKRRRTVARVAPSDSVPVHNLSDRQYCCVWNVEVYQDGYRPDVARELLARVARHVSRIPRERGWRVKRLMESASTKWIGLCTTNGRTDADAASTNIQLNLRVQSAKHCRQFRSFQQVLEVLLHEITHTSIGLEDIHPPSFWELLEEIKQQEGKVAQEYANPDNAYGCDQLTTTRGGTVQSIQQAAVDILGVDPMTQTGEVVGEPQLVALTAEDCCVKKGRRHRRRSTATSGSKQPKRIPLPKGAKMVDGRTKQGKAHKADKEQFTPHQLAARAALARLGIKQEEEEDDDEDEEVPVPHSSECACRSCEWDQLLFLPN